MKKNNINYESIGKIIRDLRISRNITQEKLAEMMDLSVSHIRNIESNNARVSLPVIVEFANIFKVSVDFLLRDSLDNKKTTDTNTYLEIIKNYIEKQLKILIKIFEMLKNF